MAKRKSVQQIFKDRMEREGRLEEFLKRWREYCKEHNKMPAPAVWAVMKEFGFIDATTERRMLFDRNEAERTNRLIIEEAKAELRTEARNNFESAISKLPQNFQGILPPDLLWIYSHPAMSRLHRQKDKTNKILLEAEDLEHSVKKENGEVIVANQGSIQMLQHYVNKPDEFYKNIVDKMKKESPAQKEAEEDIQDSEDDWEKIADMIERAANASD